MIYVVIPVHDRIAFTLTCLADLERQTRADVTVVVVDDGSVDGTSEAAGSRVPVGRAS